MLITGKHLPAKMESKQLDSQYQQVSSVKLLGIGIDEELSFKSMLKLCPIMSSSIDLFNQLKWIPFYEAVKVNKGVFAFKRITGEIVPYLYESMTLNREQHRLKHKICQS